MQGAPPSTSRGRYDSCVSRRQSRTGERGGFLAALTEIDFHLVVLVVALAIPVLGFRLPPWLGVAFGLLVPQGRILGHASDRRRRGEPWLAYTIVNEAFVLAVVGAYARLR